MSIFRLFKIFIILILPLLSPCFTEILYECRGDSTTYDPDDPDLNWMFKDNYIKKIPFMDNSDVFEVKLQGSYQFGIENMASILNHNVIKAFPQFSQGCACLL